MSWQCKYCDYKTTEGSEAIVNMGTCPKCGKPMALERFDPLSTDESEELDWEALVSILRSKGNVISMKYQMLAKYVKVFKTVTSAKVKLEMVKRIYEEIETIIQTFQADERFLKTVILVKEEP